MKKIKYHFSKRNIKNLRVNQARNKAKKRILFIDKHMHDPLFRKFLKEEKMNYKKRGQRKSFYRMLMIATVTKRRWLDALEERRKQ